MTLCFKVLMPIALFLLSKIMYGQGIIEGKLLDSATKQPLPYATITIFKAIDTSLITFRLSTQDGNFKVTNLPLNLSCRAVITYTGYEVYRKEFYLSSSPNIDLGNILMNPASSTLEEVLVLAEQPPITVRKDTIEFNASSFKTLPTALVEDLLRKLPGVNVDKSGTISANGKRVNRILVDGKSFFGDDPRMATQNLPANVIDKVQVTDDREEAARSTDGNITNIGKVINLTLKKGIRKGWFGKLYAGGGDNARYEAGGIANIFRDTLQLSLLGFSNNVGRAGFSLKEIGTLGGFDRSGIHNRVFTNYGGQQAFALNGISFGGTDPGIARSSGGGLNLNHAPDKRRTFFAQYFLGNSKSNLHEKILKQDFFTDSSVITTSDIRTAKKAMSHHAGIGTNLQLDSSTTLNFRASWDYQDNDDHGLHNVLISDHQTHVLGSSAGNLFQTTLSNNYRHNAILTRTSRNSNRRIFNFSHSLENYRNKFRYTSEFDNYYFSPDNDSLQQRQQRKQLLPDFNTFFNINLLQPINSIWSVRVNSRYELKKEKQHIDVINQDMNGKYNEPFYFSSFKRNQHIYSTATMLQYRNEKWFVSAGLTGQWQAADHGFSTAPPEFAALPNWRKRYFNWLPMFQLQYNDLSVRYQKEIVLPSVSDVGFSSDSTNPLFIRYGNKFLEPANVHTVELNSFTYIPNLSLDYYYNLRLNRADNDVVYSRVIKTNGVQEIQPINANGSLRIIAQVGMNKDFKANSDIGLSVRLNAHLIANRKKLILNGLEGFATTIQYFPGIGFGLNYKDILELRPQYAPLFSNTRYEKNLLPKLNAYTHNTDLEWILRWPGKLVWEQNILYRYNRQVGPGLPRSNFLWNAGVTLPVSKNENALLRLSVYDLLNRNNNFTRVAMQNQVIDQQTNILQRFFLLTFTYNIRTIGPERVGGKDRLLPF